MATVQSPATPQLRPGVRPLRAAQGSSYWLRKLHSLLGIVPLGAFLLEHLLSNFEALHGAEAYGKQVQFLNSLPLVRVLEWVFIFLPLLYHAFYGLYVWIRGKSNVIDYPWIGNWMYGLQRCSGIIAFLFIGYHVATQRFLGVSLPENPMQSFAKVQAAMQNPLIAGFYAIAMIAVCWHFSYGIWLFAAKWGITTGPKARKNFGYICILLGAGMACFGLLSMTAFLWNISF